jgi:hypothetical protein
MLKRRNRQGRNDWHRQAAEFHDMAAHAHRLAAAHHGKEDHALGHEISRQAMEFAVKAHRMSQEAYESSKGFVRQASKGAGAGSVRGVVKSKKKR